MLEFSHSLILNEDALNELASAEQRLLFIYEWLCFLNQVLVAAQQVNQLTDKRRNMTDTDACRAIFDNVNRKSSSNYFDKRMLHQDLQFDI
jgi:hypothetical protein